MRYSTEPFHRYFRIFTRYSKTSAKEVSFTQENRDRLIRLEEGLKAVNQRIDNLQTFMLWGFGIGVQPLHLHKEE